MAYNPYSEMIGRAVVDRHFQARLLNGSRAQILQEMGFSPAEQAALMVMPGTSLREFAMAVHNYLCQQRSPTLWLLQDMKQ